MALSGCEQLREVAPDVALGLLTGEERAAALAHLEGCEACRAEVSALAVTADDVLLATPEVMPPQGFERRVLARLADLRPQPAHMQPSPRRHRGRRIALAAMTAAAVTVVVLGVLLVGPDDPGTESASAEILTGRGRLVGEATVSGDPAMVAVDVPEWAGLVEAWGKEAGPDATYWLAVEFEDGSRSMTHLTADDASWRVALEVSADDVAGVAVLDGEGRVWCTARFST
jgi:hypothetical protein